MNWIVNASLFHSSVTAARALNATNMQHANAIIFEWIESCVVAANKAREMSPGDDFAKQYDEVARDPDNQLMLTKQLVDDLRTALEKSEQDLLYYLRDALDMCTTAREPEQSFPFDAEVYRTKDWVYDYRNEAPRFIITVRND